MNDTIITAITVVGGVTHHLVDIPVFDTYIAVVTIFCGTVAVIRAGIKIFNVTRDFLKKKKTAKETRDAVEEIFEEMEDSIK